MKQKIIAVLMVLLCLLAGCGNGQLADSTGDTTTEATTPNTTVPEATEPQTEILVRCQYLPETVDNSDNLPVLKWVCLTEWVFCGGNWAWTEDAAVEINQTLADRNMPFRLQLVMMRANRTLFLEDFNWFTCPQAQAELEDADLVFGYMTPEEMVTHLLSITEHVAGTAQPSLKTALPHKYYWNAGTINNEIYGYNTSYMKAGVDGWSVDEKIFTEYGLTVEDFQYDFTEMDATFAKIYAANGNKPFITVAQDGLVTSNSEIETIYEVRSIPPTNPGTLTPVGSFFAMDYSGDIVKIVNYLEDENYRNWRAAVMRYKEAGYMKESLDEDERLVFTSANGHFVYTKGGIVNIPVGQPSVGTQMVGGLINGLSVNTQHKEEALQLLALIGNDEAFRMQLFFGKEGRDYTFIDGVYARTILEDGSRYRLDFVSPLACFCGMSSDKYLLSNLNVQGEPVMEGKTLLETTIDGLNQAVPDNRYPARTEFKGVDTGILYLSFEGFEEELKALKQIADEHFPRFTALTDQEYAQMLQEMKDAGSDRIVAELQRQLEEWEAKHPEWRQAAA